MAKQSKLILSAMQMCSTPDVNENIAFIEQQLMNAELVEQQIVVLPECCLFFGGQPEQQLAAAKQDYLFPQMKAKLSALAKRFSITLVAGSIPVFQPKLAKFTNSCFVFNADGTELACYDKLHLFDVAVQDNEKNYYESQYVLPGESLVTVDAAESTIGLSICYDLRFPALFSELRNQGANIITVPSAFTRVTGKAHWQALLQARAIENQVYIIAASQEGVHLNGRETWGHSMIISPWGDILTQKTTGTGMVSAQYDEQELVKVRSAMPVATHNRFKNKLI